jgi:hypothetical protein
VGWPCLPALAASLKILGSGAKPRSPQNIRRSLSCGTICQILRPHWTQTTMKAWNAPSCASGGIPNAEGTDRHSQRQKPP